MLATSEPTNAKCGARIFRRIGTSVGTTSRAGAKTARISATRAAKIGSNIAKISGTIEGIGLRKFGTMRGISTMISSTTLGGAIGAGELGGPATILLIRGGGGAAQLGFHWTTLSLCRRIQRTSIMG